MPLVLYICRHGETEWTRTGQHTGVTDIPLTKQGEAQATALGRRLKPLDFTRVYTSPLRRAQETCHLAGYGANAIVEDDLLEWNYGDYEGQTTAEIRRSDPGWSIFSNGAPGGESAEAIGERADRFLGVLAGIEGDVAIFSSGHFSRVLAARWLGQPPGFGRHLDLSTASLSILGTYREDHVIKLWNDTNFR